MSQKRKSTLKARVLTVLLIVLFGGSCAVLVFAVCTGQLSRDNNNEKYTEPPLMEASTLEEIGVDSISTSSAKTEPASTVAATALRTSLSFAPKYEILSVCDENGASMELSVAFGADFTKGSVEFSDGRFFINLPVQGKPDSYGGSYKLVSASEAELRYDNSDIKTAFINEVDSSGVITAVDITMSSDFVITCVRN